MLKHLLCLPFLLLLICGDGFSQSNEGTEFWCGFMEHFDVDNNEKVVMITSKFSTSGKVNIPHRNWSREYSVEADQVTLINLPSFAENKGSEFVNNLGVQVISNDPVSVYIHQYHQFRSEAALVLPVGSLGKDYYAMTYTGVKRDGIDYPSEFLIIATEDETNIEIKVSANTQNGKSAGSSFTIKLNRGDTYQVRAKTAIDDLSGSRISGDNNFAVFSGNSWTEVPTGCQARDNLMEQMYAIEFWGKLFATVPSKGMPYDVFRIMAAEDNTSVKIEGGNQPTDIILNEGEFYETRLSLASLMISDKPILVGQFIIGQGCSGYAIGDPSMLILNSVTQTRDTVTLFNSSLRDIDENYISIISKTADLPLITIDGNEIPDNAKIGPVATGSQYSYVIISVSNGAHTIVSEGCGIIATAYGYGPLESYSYSGGASFNSINANPIPDGGCLNDTVFFDANLPEERYSYLWELGNGEIHTEKTFEKIYSELGSFSAQLIVFDDCVGTIDTFYKDLLITTRKAVESAGDSSLCALETIVLGASDVEDANYLWMGPNGFVSEEQFPLIFDAGQEYDGQFSVVGIVSGCATLPAFVDIEIWPLPIPIFNVDSIYCGKNEDIILDSGDFTSYLWQDGSTENQLLVESEGIYSVTVTNDFGCEFSTEIRMVEKCPTEIFIPNIFSPNEDGINDEWQVHARDITTFSVEVKNRWGEIMYTSEDPNEIWNAKHLGADVMEGVYLYRVEIEGIREDGGLYKEILSGTVTIIR